MRALERVRGGLLARGMPAAAGAVSSLASSVRSGHRVRVTVDTDGDWTHQWGRGEVLVSGAAWGRPAAHVVQHHATFLWGYSPRPGDTVVDCGAGVGTEVRLFAQSVGPAGRVVAVEPDPDAFRRLRKTTALLGLAQVDLVQCALGIESGSASLHRGTHVDAVEAAVLASSWNSGPPDPGEAVAVRRLDELLGSLGLAAVDLLKVNVEGAELDVLLGLGERLADVRNVCVSCHDFLPGGRVRTLDATIALLSAGGFEVSRNAAAPASDAAAYYVYGRRSMVG